MKKIHIVLFTIVIALAVYLRLYDISANPAGFFTDEAAIGYNSYKILTTGKDEHDVSFPMFFESYGDYRLPLPIYLNIPSILLFGTTDYAIRFTAAVAGILTVVALMATITVWLGGWAGVGAGLSLAILPWHIHMSRWGSEYVYFPLFFTIGLLLLTLYSRSKRASYSILSFAFFGLSMYTYYPAIFTVPLFLMPISIVSIFSFRKDKKKLLALLMSCITFVIVIMPIIGSLSSGQLMSRWRSVEDKNARINTETAQRFWKYYTYHFDPKFLFIQGDENVRHAVQHYGELHLLQAMFILLGVVFIILKKRSLEGFAILLIFLLYPLGSAVTFERLATRSVIGVIPMSILCGIGIAWFVHSLERLSNKFVSLICILIFCLVLFLSMGVYTQKLFVEYPTYSGTWDGFQYGYKQAMEYCLRSANQYDECRITHRFNRSEGLIAFYKISMSCRKCIPHPNPIEINPKRRQLFFVRDEDVQEARELYPELTFFGVGNIYNPGGAVELKIGYFQ